MAVLHASSKDFLLEQQIQQTIEEFSSVFKKRPAIIAKAPGRAEIIGNHTDYNNGYALGAAISKNTLAAVSFRDDRMVSVFSDTFDKNPNSFSLDELARKIPRHWTNYVKAITSALSLKKPLRQGFDMLISSNVPSSGGVSSSAALELSVGLSLSHLFEIKLSNLELAILCQLAENGPLVDSPCGFLDQATSGLSKKGKLTFLDFLPKDGLPISRIEFIPAFLDETDVSFIIAVDKNVKRSLGQSGYPKRRAMCEQSLPILSQLSGKTIGSLRDISTFEFEKHKKDLEKIDTKMRMRVEHIVYENERVLSAVEALKKKDLISFGNLLTKSGKSALELYELDEKTPELTFLLHTARDMRGVLGARNMGGGFSANILTLIKSSQIDMFTSTLSSLYKNKYHTSLEFTQFQPADGAQICYINN